MTREGFKETYFDLDGCDLSEASKIYHCIDRGESDLADKILSNYANKRVIDELDELLSLHYPTPDAVVISAIDIEKRIQELKQEV